MTLGAVLVAILALIGGNFTGDRLAARLSREAALAIERAGGRPVQARFVTAYGWPTRHPTLSGGEGLQEDARDRVAKAVAAVPGVGGIRWADGHARVQQDIASGRPVQCEEQVEALLRARTIRFEESSARIEQASAGLVDEVADALRPCLGSIIAIKGHTDSSGPEPGNLELSRSRADAVRSALITRGIPADGLRARGVGSREPVTGLDPADPANRRINFDVVATEAITPTPVDTPGPG